MNKYIETFITEAMVEHAEKAKELRDSYAKLNFGSDIEAAKLIREQFEKHEKVVGMLVCQDIIKELDKEEIELLTKIEEA